MKRECINIRDFFELYFDIDDKNLECFTHDDIKILYGDIGQLSETDDVIRMYYDGYVIRVSDTNDVIKYYQNPVSFNAHVKECVKIPDKPKKKDININGYDLDELSIYELTELLKVLKEVKKQAEIHLVSKCLRKKSLDRRGVKKKSLERIRKEGNCYD